MIDRNAASIDVDGLDYLRRWGGGVGRTWVIGHAGHIRIKSGRVFSLSSRDSL